MMYDSRDYKRYLREREKYPLFADDSSIVRPPRTVEEAEERREYYRREIEKRLKHKSVYNYLVATHYLKQCRAARIPGADVWAALRWFRSYNLGWEFAADALWRLLKRHGIEAQPAPRAWEEALFKT